MILNEFYNRIQSARDLNELGQVASELAKMRATYENQGVIRKPEGGDQDIKEVVKDLFRDQLGAIEKIIFASAWSLADKGPDEALEKGAKTALWEALKVMVEDQFGTLAKEITSAVEDMDFKGFVNAAAAAAGALMKSLKDRNGILNETLRILRKNGLILEKSIEYSLRRWLFDVLDKVESIFKAILTLLASPVVIFIRLTFLNPSKIATDSGELYIAFQGLSRKLERRSQELLRSEIPYQWTSPVSYKVPTSSGPTLNRIP